MATVDNLMAPEVGTDYVRAPETFVSVSPVMKALNGAIENVACSEVPLLILGEPGTGKRALALQIHQQSARSREAFSEVECSGLGPEYFNDRNATGTLSSEFGTVVLHQVSFLGPESQAALMDLLVQRSQTGDTVTNWPRLIFTTHVNLEQEIRLGRFREDLYYRISSFCLRVPPLRHRKEDIGGLADLFLTKYALRLQCTKPNITELTRRFLAEYGWPGNVRELEEATRTIAAVGDEKLALAALRSAHRGARRQPERALALSLKEASKAASRAAEKDLILRVLSRTRWNRKRAAGELKISYKALLYKLKQMGVQNPNANSQGEA
jgi:two-component system response regulator AtoC